MRWYKHFTDNHRGQTVQTLLNEHGHAGVCAYYFIMELCAEKMEKNEAPVFVFKRPYFDNVLRMKRKHSENILRTLSESNVLKSEVTHNEVRIEFPILLNLLDRDMKRTRVTRERNAQNTRLELELDKELELYNDHQRTQKRVLSESLIKQIYEEYPRKVGKGKGLNKLKAQLKTEDDFNKCLHAVLRFKNYHIEKRTEPQYIPHFSTWVSSWQDCLDDNFGHIDQPVSRAQSI